MESMQSMGYPVSLYKYGKFLLTTYGQFSIDIRGCGYPCFTHMHIGSRMHIAVHTHIHDIMYGLYRQNQLRLRFRSCIASSSCTEASRAR